MKKTLLIIVILFLIGMPVFSQNIDLSFYIHEYNRTDATVFDMLDILRAVRDENRTGIGEFYHNAITVFVQKLPNFYSNRERFAVEEASRLILRGLSAERHVDSASYIWTLLQYFNISSHQNDGLLMYEAIVALGLVDAKSYAVHIADLLTYYNERFDADAVTKGRIPRVALGCFSALENLKEPIGVKPVFYASIGWYDNDVKAQASNSLERLMSALDRDIIDVIISVIKDPFNGPIVKNAAWQALLRTGVSGTSKAKVAVAALEVSYTFVAQSYEARTTLRNLRMTAIDTIRLYGVEDEIVYPFLERTYREAFDTPNTDFEVLIEVVKTLQAIKTEQAVDLLTEFLRWNHSRRQSGPWGNVEKEIMVLLIPAIGATGTQSRTTLQLLFSISRNSLYTNDEQQLARNALAVLNR